MINVELDQNRRPHISVIKLIECVGTLLEIPKSSEKSYYRAPLPSNYDKTIEKFKGNFYGVLRQLSTLQSSDIKNEVASDFYNKTLEPGFNYEDAINAGGLMSDENRLPVCKLNMAVLVDGTRSSYVAFDTACHIHNHGILNILAFTTDEEVDGQLLNPTGATHLLRDLNRRCKSHYKFPEHTFKLVGISCPIENLENQPQIVENNLIETNSSIFVMGISDYNIGEAGTNALSLWAAWQFSGDVVLCKGLSPIRPFSQVTSSRTFLLYLDSKDESKVIFLKGLKFMRPGDSIVVLTIVEDRNPVGDSRDTRFGFGHKQGLWTDGPEGPQNEPDSVGWNDKEVENVKSSFEEMIKNSFLDGYVRVETKAAGCSIGKAICDVAFAAAADAILIGSRNNRESVIECVRESYCSIIVIK